MNPAQSLHTAARRYCSEQFGYWAERYSKICDAGRDRDGYEYTPEALGIFPRYNVLRAILVEIERLVSETLTDLDETREWMILAGNAADDVFTCKPFGQIEADAMAEERQAFCDFVRGLSIADLQTVEPLPYRRVLSKAQSESSRSRLRDRWQLGASHWFPLEECSLADVAAFQEHFFHEFAQSFHLADLLASRGITRIWELRESGPDYELEVFLFDPCYNGAEGYWSAGELDWIVYASHEGSVTVGGWLLAEIKERWPEWSQRIWESPFF